MLKAPAKPVEEMTEEELRQWKEWLLYQGTHPQPIDFPKPLSGSVYHYDPERKAVIETTSVGLQYIVEIRNNALERTVELIRHSTAR